MIGWTLGRYFFARYATITLAIFAGLFALIFIIDFTEFSNRTSGLPNYSLPLALASSAMRVPMLMQQSVPFIGLFAAMATLISLNRKYELVIARSAGVSAWQFLFPACVGAFIFGVAAIAILNPIAANGLMSAERLEAEIRSGQSNRVTAADAPWIKQTTDEGDTIIGARAVLSQGLELVDASFFRFDGNGNIVERFDATRAWLRDGAWELTGVTSIKGDGQRESLDNVTVKFHSLVALPLLLVSMTLIAATVSMRFARLGQSAVLILGGILAGFLLYVVTVLVKAFGSSGVVPPVVAAWFPVVLAMFFGVTFLLHKEDG
jgi:lipopolysaccharide export system permease protein